MGIRIQYRLGRSVILLTFAGAQLMQPLPCSGQEISLAPYSRIRVESDVPPEERRTGSYLGLEHDSLTFEVRGETQRVAVSDIRSLEVSTGEKSRLPGTIVGGVTGALAGAWLGATIDKAWKDSGCTDYCDLTGGVIGFVVGAIGGSVAGYSWLGHEKWTDVPVESLRVSIRPGLLQLQIAM